MISLWRYSHLLLAAVSAIFLLLASVSGALLALDPITQSIKAYRLPDSGDVLLSETVSALQSTYPEVLELKITPEGIPVAQVVTAEGESASIIIHPETAEKLGEAPSPSSFFQWVTTFHRSLFLKGIGRAFVGVVSVLLILIALSGVFLLARRQGGFRRWFTAVKEGKSAATLHVRLGRWFLLPILFVAATGVFLSAEKFQLLPEGRPEVTVNSSEGFSSEGTQQKHPSVFGSITLGEVRQVLFPFSEAAEDYFEVSLTDRELHIRQYDGLVLKETVYPVITLLSQWSLTWHSGQGSAMWSLVLLGTALSLLYFMYSGFAVWWKRRKNRLTTNKITAPEEARFIVLTGSEGGSTTRRAAAFAKALESANQKVHLVPMNDYGVYPKATHLILFTSTYGNGEAPASAVHFKNRVTQTTPAQPLHYSVVGFGSRRYEHFCGYALEVEEFLRQQPTFHPMLPPALIDEEEPHRLNDWITHWNEETGMTLTLSATEENAPKAHEHSFTIVECRDLNADDTVVLRLRSDRPIPFTSGDLLLVTPPGERHPRKYSIARIEDDIVLSIRKHANGRCSPYLCNLKKGDILKASIEENSHFHLPETNVPVWMIANGTGIAPFLGMLHQEIHAGIRLTWGLRSRASLEGYGDYLNCIQHKHKNRLRMEVVYSSEEPGCYVQDVLREQTKELSETLKAGGIIMICGSVHMQREVMLLLEEACRTHLAAPLDVFLNKQQVRTDCY